MEQMTESESKLVQELERVANFLRGMTLDPRIQGEVKEAVVGKVQHLDSLTEEWRGY